MRYRELPPSPEFAEAIECFWRMESEGDHRVTPDGCADIVLSESGLVAVGAMTAFEDIGTRAVTMGVRFQPAMWARQLKIDAQELTDRVVPLEDVWGKRARAVASRLDPGMPMEEVRRAFESVLEPVRREDPFQRAVAALREGQMSVDELADQCGLSARQLRRVSLRKAGLTPKFLARVLRFRRATSLLAWGRAVEIALECGYYDQAHLINEFREFTGRAPFSSASVADFSNTSGG
jgi:AraC-like DNA-binding protein